LRRDRRVEAVQGAQAAYVLRGRAARQHHGDRVTWHDAHQDEHQHRYAEQRRQDP
jgi:hypothetical protein